MRQRDLSTETRAEPLKQSFIDSHMAPDFHRESNAAAENFEVWNS